MMVPPSNFDDLYEARDEQYKFAPIKVRDGLFFQFSNFFFLDCVVALSESRKYQTKTMEVCSRDGR